MDSLAGRLERLTPEQRKSVEDYIDFLLSRIESQGGENARTAPPPDMPAAAPPPLIPGAEVPPMMQAAPETPHEPSRIKEIAPGKGDALVGGYLDYGVFESAQKSPPSPADKAVERVKKRMKEKKEETPADNLLEWVE